MNKKKVYAFLCCLNLLNKYSNKAKGITNPNNTYQISNQEDNIKLTKIGKNGVIASSLYCALNRTARLFINTGNTKTQRIINFFIKNKNSKNWASVPISQYKHPVKEGKECEGKFWSEEKLRSGGRMIIYSPEKENVKKVWMCFAGCSSYGLDALEDVWRSVVSVHEPGTAFVAVDYPGYGEQAPGCLMDKKKFKSIADEVVNKVSEKYDNKSQQVKKCIWGHSLGTFPASWTVGDDRISEIYLHSPVNLSKILNKIVGQILVIFNGENLNAIDNLLNRAKKRKTSCKIIMVSGGREQHEPGDGPYEFLCLKNTLPSEYGKKLKKLVDDKKLNITCKIKKSAGHCNMFKIDDIEAKDYNYLTGKIEEGT